MRQVMGHGDEFAIPIRLRKILSQMPFLGLRRVQLAILSLGILWLLEGGLEGFISESMSQEIHFVHFDLSCLQTIFNRMHGKFARGFLPSKTFLGRACSKLARTPQ